MKLADLLKSKAGQAASNTIAINTFGGRVVRSHSGWREIGGKRIYARSRWEANYARYLEWQKRNGDIIDWEHEPETFWFKGIQRGVCSYLPDFRVTTKTGVEYHEVKGYMDSKSKTKLKRMAKYHPAVKVVLRDSQFFRANSKKLAFIVKGWEK